jgi:hypothetical protein
LTFAFDNCSGQNKNGMVLKLVVCSVEMGHFEEVEFLFLIVRHAKNPADRLFNVLKTDCRSMNLCPMKHLICTVSTNEFVTAVQAEEDVFKDFMEHQQQFCKPFQRNTIKICHMFSSHQDKKGVLRCCESDLIREEEKADLEVAGTLRSKGCFDPNDTKLLDDVPEKLEATKTKTTQHLTKKGTDGLNRKEVMKAGMRTPVPPGVRDTKQVEMTKFKNLVPEKEQVDRMCKTPDSSVIKTIKDIGTPAQAC